VFPSARAIARAPTLGDDTAVPGDPEAILLTRSDAILSWSWFAAPLMRIGAPLVQLDSRASGDVPQSVEYLWRLIGAVSDRRERVDFLIRRHQAEVDAISKDRPAAPVRRKVAYLFQIDPLIMAFGGTGIDVDLDRVDAHNIGASLHSPHMTIEELIVREPEVIIISGYPKDDAVRQLLDNPALRCTPAVRSKRVYREPHGGTGMEGLVEEPIMLQWMSEVIYPEWTQRRFRMKLRHAYADVYGFNLTDDAIDEALVLRENASSAEYARFLASNDAERR
jgi:iron complex transport system substrate-binding protein